MSSKTELDTERFTFTLFKRRNKDGSFVFYARLIDQKSGKILAQRSTGTDDERKAAAKAGQFLVGIPLAEIANYREQEDKNGAATAIDIRSMKLAKYFVWFWSPESFYIADRANAEKKLSSEYIQTQSRYVARHAINYEPFKTTPLAEANLLLIEQWMRHLKREGVKNNVIVTALNALRTPLSWAKNRNLLREPFTVSGIMKPKQRFKKRGILTRQEIAALILLPVADFVKPRPRLKGGDTNKGTAPIDLRMKAIVLLSELAALRRGEIRALRWRHINLETNLISIEDNFVRGDGFKAPKRGSAGVVPITSDLQDLLKNLKKLASSIGRDRQDDFVIFNLDESMPVAEITVKRSYRRALALIGIEDDSKASREHRDPHLGSQQARHLVLHSGRHGANTRLAEAIGSRAAARVTRHRNEKAFEGYADHDTKEALDNARTALSIELEEK